MSLETEFAQQSPRERDLNYEQICRQAAAENAARRQAAFRALVGEGEMDRGLHTVPSEK